MKRFRSGFTLVEVSLFLAITAAIFVGVAVGTQNSIFQQRYNDSVQSFTEFLRSVYSQVLNVQNENLGRSNQAIYGKIVVFGVDGNENKIVSYNVIGDIGSGAESNNMLELMASLKIKTKNDGGNPVGFVEDYKPKWGSQIQTVESWNDGKYQMFKGALLILRHPDSGTVNTYFTNEVLDVKNPLNDFKKDKDAYKNFKFNKGSDIDFCINPNGAEKANLRRDVRIMGNARNSSGIEIVGDENSEDNEGNRCK